MVSVSQQHKLVKPTGEERALNEAQFRVQAGNHTKPLGAPDYPLPAVISPRVDAQPKQTTIICASGRSSGAINARWATMLAAAVVVVVVVIIVIIMCLLTQHSINGKGNKDEGNNLNEIRD